MMVSLGQESNRTRVRAFQQMSGRKLRYCICYSLSRKQFHYPGSTILAVSLKLPGNHFCRACNAAFGERNIGLFVTTAFRYMCVHTVVRQSKFFQTLLLYLALGVKKKKMFCFRLPRSQVTRPCVPKPRRVKLFSGCCLSENSPSFHDPLLSPGLGF